MIKTAEDLFDQGTTAVCHVSRACLIEHRWKMTDEAQDGRVQALLSDISPQITKKILNPPPRFDAGAFLNGKRFYPFVSSTPTLFREELMSFHQGLNEKQKQKLDSLEFRCSYCQCQRIPLG